MWLRTLRGIVTLILSLLLMPLAADAQPGPKIPRIGVLGRTPGSAGSFRQALRDLGYREGQTIAMEYRWAEGGTGSVSCRLICVLHLSNFLNQEDIM